MAGSATQTAQWMDYDTDSEDESTQNAARGSTADSELAPTSSAPLHPMPSFQGAFGESILESIEEQTGALKRDPRLGAKARRQRMLEEEEYDQTYNAQWRRNPQARYHPLWKLLAQISFGVHLLQQRLAKSDEEVVKILQKHVDEVDTFLERTTEDFDLSNQDIKERINHLKLPLEHINIFDIMLDDEKFRADIIEGNRKIELIVTRTARAMNDALVDVSKGVEAVTELAKYLDSIGPQVSASDGQTSSIYEAMKGNTDGWLRCFRTLQSKGNDLTASLVQLGNVLSEMSRRAGVASRRAASREQTRAKQTMLAPTSKYSSAHSANTQGKPLPRPPRSGTSSPLHLETPNVVASRSDSRSQTSLVPPSPRSPGFYSTRTHSPLATSPRVQSPQLQSPLAGSPRPLSPASSSGQETSPFEGRFESVRPAPKPPARKETARTLYARSPEAADSVGPLSPKAGAPSSIRTSPAPEQRTGSVKRSGSLIKRLRRNLSKDANSERLSQQTQKSPAQTHERSMTSDLADLMEVTGVNDTPRQSHVAPPRTSQNGPQKAHVRAGSVLSSKAPSLTAGRLSRDTRRPTSPTQSTVVPSSGRQSFDHLDPDAAGIVRRRKSLDRFLGESSLAATRSTSPVPTRRRSPPPKRALSPGLPRPLTPLSQTDVSDESTPRGSQLSLQPPGPPSPISLVQPSPIHTPRPQSPTSTLGGPQTPTQRSRLALFPSNRPLTPSAMSYTSEAPSYASPTRRHNPSMPSFVNRWVQDEECPAPGVARSRAYSTYSNTSSAMFKTGELVGGATIVSNRDEKKKSGFGRLKHWVSGKKDGGGSRLRNAG